nr:DNA replication/repair protein RecF [uncultured Neokomagataea sp.]
MDLLRLTLTDFRNYTRANWTPSHPITVFTGPNGAGKTNLLEAVSLLSPGRGLRSSPLPQLCRTHAQEWGIAAILSGDHGEQIRIGTGAKQAEQRRNFHIDGRPVRSQTAIAPYFSCVWLTPQMDRLFQEGASGRRRFLDRLVIALTPDHAREITAHDRSVSSRNRVLQEQPHADLWLNAIEDSIARHATAATAARLALIEHMNAQTNHHAAFPECYLGLDCSIAEHLKTTPALKVEETLRAQLKASRITDREQRLTSHGAHRADLLLSDKATARPAHLSSSGQQRALLTGIILAHADLITSLRGQAPALLLDEPLVHLDETRRDALLETLKHRQSLVLMTGTDHHSFKALHDHAAFLSVKDGLVLPS